MSARAADTRIDEIRDALSPLGPVEARSMFGGHGLTVDGAMVAIVTGGTVYLKTDDGNRAAFEEAGLEPFTYASARGRVTTSFRRAPEPLGDWDVLGPLATGSLDAARRALARRRPRRPRRHPGLGDADRG